MVASLYQALRPLSERWKSAFRRPPVGLLPSHGLCLVAGRAKSMAVAPDPKTFASWEEAFEYPIPAVRGMERQLRRDIDSNHERLRTLVGYNPTIEAPTKLYEIIMTPADTFRTLQGKLPRPPRHRRIDHFNGFANAQCGSLHRRDWQEM